jgi:hypothetical protein
MGSTTTRRHKRFAVPPRPPRRRSTGQHAETTVGAASRDPRARSTAAAGSAGHDQGVDRKSFSLRKPRSSLSSPDGPSPRHDALSDRGPGREISIDARGDPPGAVRSGPLTNATTGARGDPPGAVRSGPFTNATTGARGDPPGAARAGPDPNAKNEARGDPRGSPRTRAKQLRPPNGAHWKTTRQQRAAVRPVTPEQETNGNRNGA